MSYTFEKKEYGRRNVVEKDKTTRWGEIELHPSWLTCININHIVCYCIKDYTVAIRVRYVMADLIISKYNPSLQEIRVDSPSYHLNSLTLLSVNLCFNGNIVELD